MDILGDLKGLVDALQLVDVRASLDPAKLNPPAVFVTLDALTDWTLSGRTGTTRARLTLIVPDRDYQRSLEQLQDLFAAALTVVTPTSDVEATTAVMPDTSELPALTFTMDI